jgi:hypothetical protein
MENFSHFPERDFDEDKKLALKMKKFLLQFKLLLQFVFFDNVISYGEKIKDRILCGQEF